MFCNEWSFATGEVTRVNIESIGQRLREARMRAGIPLEEASHRTKIRVKILEALESGELDRIPGGEVYARNFLLSYARFLETDVQAILAEFDKAHPGATDRAKVLQGGPAPVHWTPAPPAYGRRTGKGRLWGAGLVALVLVAVAVVLVAWLGDLTGSGEQAGLPGALGSSAGSSMRLPAEGEAGAAVQPESPGADEAAEGGGESGEAAGSGGPGGTTGAPAEQAASTQAVPPTLAFEPLVLRAVLEERSWMRVDVDGRTEYTGILQAGEERTWTANEEIRIRFGYAQGVRIYLNGHDLGPAGEDVVTRSFTRATLQQLEGRR